MRNKAKCALCKSIIESFALDDYVMCECEEIAISGGDQKFLAYAKDFKNFLRVDDNGNEIKTTFVDEQRIDLEKTNTMSKEDLLLTLKQHIETYDQMPSHHLEKVVTKYELFQSLLVIYALLRA